jgi:hypothetical protein
MVSRAMFPGPVLMGLAIVLVAALATIVSDADSGSNSAAEQAAWKAISARSLLNDINTLSSNEFEGRAPATRGEQLTVDFLLSRFKSLGLEPGNPDGTYLQNVPLVGIKADPSAELEFSKQPGAPEAGMGKSSAMHLRYGPDFVAWTKRVDPEVKLDAPLVFVGYGVVAPEYHWDDYKNVDVRGKVLVMLINDPQIPDPKDPSQLDAKMFKGRAMTYYGRWTYKFEIAAAKGAAGALIVHETGPAGIPGPSSKAATLPNSSACSRQTRGIPAALWKAGSRSRRRGRSLQTPARISTLCTRPLSARTSSLCHSE